MKARQVGTRICVVGTSGSGKTFMAERIAARRGLRHVISDALIWGANWEPVPRAEQYRRLDEATREDGWVFDGNLGPSAEDQLVLSRCDTLVWLDLPRWQVIASITRRTLWRALTRERLWHGNVERWHTALSRDSMIVYAWRTYPRQKQRYAALFGASEGPAMRVRLRSRGEVNRWLSALPAKD